MCNMPFCYVAVYFRQSGKKGFAEYREYYVQFDAELYQFMRKTAVDFWHNHVEKRIEPPIDKADRATVEYYKNRYPQHAPDSWAYSDENIDNLAKDYLDAVGNMKLHEMHTETMKLKLIAAIGECEGLVTASGKFTYRATKPTQKTDWQGIARSLGATDETIENFTAESPGHRRFLCPKH